MLKKKLFISLDNWQEVKIENYTFITVILDEPISVYFI